MKKLTTEEFIEKAKQVHGNKYDYSKVDYINSTTKVCIICPIHGEFWQRPSEHLYGKGCIKCSGRYTYTTKEFIEKAKEVHDNKYDYSKVNYINNKTKICIICPIHGEFWQMPENHIVYKQGCIKCGYKNSSEKQSKNINCFIEQAKQVHDNKYDYSKVNYINSTTKVCIICPKHGEFWQTPDNHLQGEGCPKCKQSKLEKEISLFLRNNNIIFEEQKKFSWMGKMSIDFYLLEYNIAIECQGKQHFKSDFFGGANGLLQTKIRDERKRRLCEQHNIKLLYYSNLGIHYPYQVYENKQELLEIINNSTKVSLN